MLASASLVNNPRVLTSPVRVKDRHTLLDRAPACCHVNGLAHQGRVHVVGHRIPHHLLGAAVQNGRKIDEPGPCPDIGGGTSRLRGNIPAQLLAGLICCEVPSEQVGRSSRSLAGTVVRTFARGCAACSPRSLMMDRIVEPSARTPRRSRTTWMRR